MNEQSVEVRARAAAKALGIRLRRRKSNYTDSGYTVDIFTSQSSYIPLNNWDAVLAHLNNEGKRRSS